MVLKKRLKIGIAIPRHNKCINACVIPFSTLFLSFERSSKKTRKLFVILLFLNSLLFYRE